MTLHIFNPGHDEALAANTPYYTDTRAANTLTTDLRTLPQHWAEEGDIWTLPTSEKEWGSVSAIAPWGWDSALTHRLYRLGAPFHLLPTAEQLAHIRQLSSRKIAVDILPEVSPFHSLWCENMAEVEVALKENQQSYIKAPWSSSGRGVLRTRGELSSSERGRVAKWIRQQGAVVIEPSYEKQQDFALEFEATTEGIIYVGLSIFSTEGMGTYSGNIVAEEMLLRNFLPPLDDTIATLQKVLERHFKGYVGPLGVDMMLLANGTIHPCVEINLRRTMGWVAVQLRHLIPPKAYAHYCIRPMASLPPEAYRLTPEGTTIQAVLLPYAQTAMDKIYSTPTSSFSQV